MRDRFAETLYNLAINDDRIFIVVADISPAGSMAKFQKQFPNRFINVGVAEQSMIGICAGLALRGALPFAYTIATFALYRPFEFIRDDLAYQNLPVTVVGIGGGVIYSTLGATHYAQEDISVATAVPGLNVFAPSTPNEVEEILSNIVSGNITGPNYLRLGKTGEINYNFHDKFIPGKLRRIIYNKSDTCILSYGVIANKLMKLISEDKKTINNFDFYSLPTVKPLDIEGCIEILKDYKKVIIVEENSIQGSIGTKLKAFAFEHKSECEMYHYSLQDAFIHCYGNHDDILFAHGINLDHIIKSLV